jgi:hypothetical protein
MDLFINYDQLPFEVQNILLKFSEMDNDYVTCEEFLKEIHPHGYSFEYGLDAQPFNLSKINF